MTTAVKASSVFERWGICFRLPPPAIVNPLCICKPVVDVWINAYLLSHAVRLSPGVCHIMETVNANPLSDAEAFLVISYIVFFLFICSEYILDTCHPRRYQ